MGTDQMFTTRIDARNGATRIALLGELDMATVATLNDELAGVEQAGAKTIVLDLRDLRFIDSAGLHALLRAYRRSEQNGHRLLMVGANRSTRRLCEITRTEFLLDAKGTAELLDRVTDEGSRAADRDGMSGTEPHV